MTPQPIIAIRPRSELAKLIIADDGSFSSTLLHTHPPQFMLSRALSRITAPRMRLAQMAAHLSNGAEGNGDIKTYALKDLPKSNVFTTKLPADEAYPTPSASHNAPRQELGPRLVKGAATEASASDKDNPTSAAFRAAQSFAPSPHISTV